MTLPTNFSRKIQAQTKSPDEEKLQLRIQEALWDNKIREQVNQGKRLTRREVKVTDLAVPKKVVDYWLEFWSDLVIQAEQENPDYDWAEKASEVQQHEGEFVAIHNQKVIVHSKDRKKAVEEAIRILNCTERDFVVVYIDTLEDLKK